jgi:hypothetical protein
VSAADALLVFHFAIVGFIVGGLLLTWAGAWLGWAGCATVVLTRTSARLFVACALTA